MNYIGCALFGLFFLMMTVQTGGGLKDRLAETLTWVHDWSPYSYVMLLIILISGVASVRTMFGHREEEDPADEDHRQIVIRVAAQPED